MFSLPFPTALYIFSYMFKTYTSSCPPRILFPTVIWCYYQLPSLFFLASFMKHSSLYNPQLFSFITLPYVLFTHFTKKMEVMGWNISRNFSRYKSFHILLHLFPPFLSCHHDLVLDLCSGSHCLPPLPSGTPHSVL